MARELIQANVVGSGPNGLAAALCLAQSGLEVRLFEARDTLGGGARSAQLTLPGFVHDVCSAIHPLALASPYFRTLPLEEHGLQWIHPCAPLAHPLDGGRVVMLERSLEATVQALGEDGRAWRRLFGPFVERWQALLAEVLAPPFHLPRSPLLLARFGLWALRPASQSARACFENAPARALFAGLCAHSTLALDAPLSTAFGLILGAAAHAVGWPMPRGGAQRISDALGALLRLQGARIELCERIGTLDQLPAAPLTLLDVTPRQFVALAGERLSGRSQRAYARYRYGPGAFKIDWALGSPIPWKAEECLRAGTVHLGGTFEEIAEAEAEVARGGHPERPFVLLAQQSLFDSTRAPEGRHSAWAYCHVPNGSMRDMTQAIERQVERFAPGFGQCILARSVRSPRELERENANLVGGDINGGALDLAQFVARPVLRVTPYATPLPGVYLCSASTPPGGGVHGMCGHNAAKAALKQLRIADFGLRTRRQRQSDGSDRSDSSDA